MLTAIIKKIKSAPQSPGVYIFYQNKIPLYIGKAANLKNRLRNYLRVTDVKIKSLHQEATDLKLIKLRSNIEALITESQLIKKLKPKYNVLWQDDKNYFYIAITKETFPKIYITHQPQSIERQPYHQQSAPSYIAPARRKMQRSVWREGPFTDGPSLKAVLRLLRRYFPYCTCSQPHFRICLNAQIGNCLGYCCQKNNQQLITNNLQLIKKYKRNIEEVKDILTGKDKKFIRKLKDPYELLILGKIWEHEPYLEVSSVQRSAVRNKNRKLSANRYPLTAKTAECYDISHLSGKEAVGAMTYWGRPASSVQCQDFWIADKNKWRKFRIHGSYTEDDPRMIEEVLIRRLNHPEWPYPDLIIIDGGINQLRAARRALRNSQLTTHDSQLKIISFAKPKQQIHGLNKKPAMLSDLPLEFQKLITTAIQNTHNFAVRYHRNIRSLSMLK